MKNADHTQKLMDCPTVDLTDLTSDEDVVIRLPDGVLLHVERIEHSDPKYRGSRVRCYTCFEDFEVDELDRREGYEPARAFFGRKIPTARNTAN